MTAIRVLLIVSVLTAVLAWSVQLLVLGVLFPHWGDGHGLLNNQDASAFNAVAMQQAALIAEHGWSAWQLRPNGWGVSGILSAWYALTWPSPAAFVPVQVLLYGVAAACLFVVFRHISGQRWLAVCGLLPLFLASSATIYAQPHRDVFVFAGFVLMVFAWLQWQQAVSATASLRWQRLIGGLVALPIGFVLAWMARPYAAEIMLGVNALMLVLLCGLAAVQVWRAPRHALIPVVAVSVALLAIALTTQLPTRAHFDRIYVTERVGAQQPVPTDRSAEANDVTTGRIDAVAATEMAMSQDWISVDWLPARLDDQFRRLATARDSFAIENHFARSAVDLDRRFGRVHDVVAYLPRALSLGLLAPFPTDWRPHPNAPSNRNAERVLAGAEMALLYVALPFFLLALYRWGRRPPVWFAVLPAAVWLTVYSLTVPVVGALVRYRFPAMVIISGIALMMLFEVIRRWRSRQHLEAP